MVPKYFYLLEDNDLCQSSQCKKSPILAPMNDSINMRTINMTSNDIVTAPSSGVDHKQCHTTQHQQLRQSHLMQRIMMIMRMKIEGLPCLSLWQVTKEISESKHDH